MYLSYLDFFFSLVEIDKIDCICCCMLLPITIIIAFFFFFLNSHLSLVAISILHSYIFLRKWWHHHCQFTITIVENSLYNNVLKQPLLKSFLILSYVHSPGNSYSSGYPKGKNQLPLLKTWLLFSELLLFLYETNSPMPWFVSHL